MDSLFNFTFYDGRPVMAESQLLGISIDTIFTVFITISIFFIGEYFVHRRSKIIEAKRLSNLKNYYLVMIRLLENPLNKQIRALRHFANNLLEAREQNLFLDKIVNSPIRQINNTDSKDLYAALVQKNASEVNNEAYIQLLSSTEYIENVLTNAILRDFNDLMEQLDSYILEYKTNFANSIKVLNHELSSNLQLKTTKTSFGRINNVRVEWLKSGNHTDIYVSKSKFVDEVRKILRETTNPDPFVHEINEHIMRCIYAFDNIDHVKSTHAELFNSYCEGLESSRSKINESIQLLTGEK